MSVEQGWSFSISVTVASIAADTCAEQIYAVTGILATDIIVVNPQLFDTAIGLAGYRVSSAGNVGLNFVNPTGDAIFEGASTEFEIVVVN